MAAGVHMPVNPPKLVSCGLSQVSSLLLAPKLQVLQLKVPWSHAATDNYTAWSKGLNVIGPVRHNRRP